MTDPVACHHQNVQLLDGEYEHYERRGPGCWHKVGGPDQCHSWQALIRRAEEVAYARAEAGMRARVAEELRARVAALREEHKGSLALAPYLMGLEDAARFAQRVHTSEEEEE